MKFTVTSRGSSPAGTGAKIFGTIFLLFFLGLGSFFLFLVGRSVSGMARTYSWRQTPCRILESQAVQAADGSKGEAFAFQVRYEYEVGGRRYESRVYRATYTGSEQISDAQRLANRYAPGSAAVCYFDPHAPEKACLERPSLWTALFLLVPLLFVLVGGGGIVAIWWPRRPKVEGAPGQAISEKGASRFPAAGCAIAFLGLFFVVGAGTSLFFVVPAYKNLVARSWNEVPCVVITSDVRRHPGSKSTTYSVNILCEYEVNGKTHRSNRYQFLGGSSGGYSAKAAVVEQNPPGTRRVCYVNPADPTDAVLTRSFGTEYWIAIVPFAFVAAGLGGMILVARSSFGKKASFPSGGRAAAEAAAAGPVVLKPAASPIGKLVGMTFVALFWNGIVSVFVLQMVKAWRSGARPMGLTLFLVPFILIGLAFLGGVFYYFLALFNPRPHITISRRAIPLGASASLDWTISGVASRITRLTIQVEGNEEAKYRRGTSTYTDRSTFATIPVFQSSERESVRSGGARFSIPADTMHSFSAPNNRIRWSLKCQGEIPRWPDVSEEFELDVMPGGPGA